jgi:hypothetical protein
MKALMMNHQPIVLIELILGTFGNGWPSKMKEQHRQ